MSLPQLLIATLSDFVTEICTAAYYSTVSVNFSHQIISGLRSGHVEFSSIFLSLFHTTGSLIGDCSGPAICHRASVMAECQRGVRNPLIWIDMWFAALIQIDL